MYNRKRFQKMNYNDLAAKAHENAVKHGFWERKFSNEHCLCLVFTEVCEAVEADRKGNYADYDGYAKMPNKQVGFEQFIKSSVEDELADGRVFGSTLCRRVRSVRRRSYDSFRFRS